MPPPAGFCPAAFLKSAEELFVEFASRRFILASIICRGVAMRWFNGNPPKDPWDEHIPWPLGDLEAARRIREICDAASPSAEKMGLGGPETNASSHEAERYKRAAKTAMEIAIKISDNLLRDSAVCQIVFLCVKANDLKTAGTLFRAIQAVSIRENALKEHPTLRSAAA
jgi:hypothetical protein